MRAQPSGVYHESLAVRKAPLSGEGRVVTGAAARTFAVLTAANVVGVTLANLLYWSLIR